MKFTEFNLHENLLQGIEKLGYQICTPVQEQVLKGSLEGADLYVQSQTGTGKTAAYLISIIQELLARTEVEGKKALIMVPTRELAVQVEQEAKSLCVNTNLKCASFYGGVGYTQQTEKLKNNVDIIIGTPGRLIDLHESKILDLTNVSFLVVDEADRMFDMGFYPDLRTLIKFLPETSKRQTMLFSATLNTYVKNLAWEYTQDAKEIEIASDNITVDEIDQELLHVASDEKMKLLLGILSNEKPESVIIFCNTKKSCEIISKRLKINGIESEYIIGDLPQSKRLQVLDSFKRGSLTCLVATDVAARGIDVNDLAMVVNYDLPNEAENYVHRIGRTARAGKTGKAYTFCSEQDVYNLPAIEKYIEKTIPSNMATEDMMIEDKSKDVYIKLNSYRDDHDDKNHSSSKYSNRANGNRQYKSKSDYSKNKTGYSKSKSDNSKNKTDYAKSKNDYSKSKSDYTKNKYAKTNTNSKSRKPDVDLSKMSFEQRMKLYKEKYGSKAETKKTTTPKQVKKLSFFDRLKIFFGKNK